MLRETHTSETKSNWYADDYPSWHCPTKSLKLRIVSFLTAQKIKQYLPHISHISIGNFRVATPSMLYDSKERLSSQNYPQHLGKT